MYTQSSGGGRRVKMRTATTSAATCGGDRPSPMALLLLSDLVFLPCAEALFGVFHRPAALCTASPLPVSTRQREGSFDAGLENEHIGSGFENRPEKCGRQCRVCIDVVGGCGWWTCSVQGEIVISTFLTMWHHSTWEPDLGCVWKRL